MYSRDNHLQWRNNLSQWHCWSLVSLITGGLGKMISLKLRMRAIICGCPKECQQSFCGWPHAVTVRSSGYHYHNHFPYYIGLEIVCKNSFVISIVKMKLFVLKPARKRAHSCAACMFVLDLRFMVFVRLFSLNIMFRVRTLIYFHELITKQHYH